MSGGKKKHMDVFLREIFKRYIAIQDVDYKKAQAVFNGVFDQVKQKMCEQDAYYAKYASEVLNAGSVYDGIKVGKLDEFDLDVVIRLPISYDDGDNGIVIENHKPGFVKLKITNAFDNLDKQQEWEKINKVTRDWRDDEKYFLQNKFRQWMQKVVQRAVNDLGGKVLVADVTYLLTFRESGPAYTLNIRNEKGGEVFALDVDLVPCIRFMLPRWPEGYRSVEGSQEKKWLVVPKPIKSMEDQSMKNRCWRLAFHDYEREIMKGCELLKLTIRLLKKLRDSLGLKEIASYYIKTLFLWEIDERQDKKYWQNKVSVLFTDMVTKFHKAVDSKTISYFWHKEHNLIEGLNPNRQKQYAGKLKEFLTRLQNNDVDSVVAYLLTPDELTDFRSSEFYKSYPVSTVLDIPNLALMRQDSSKSISSVDGSAKSRNKDDSPSRNEDCNDLLREILASNKRLESKLDSLTKRIENKVDFLSKNVDNLHVAIVDIRKEFVNNSQALDKAMTTTKSGFSTEIAKDFEGLSLSERMELVSIDEELDISKRKSGLSAEIGNDLEGLTLTSSEDIVPSGSGEMILNVMTQTNNESPSLLIDF